MEENRPNDAGDLDRLAQIFGRDSTYVEIQNAGLTSAADQPMLAELAASSGLPLVATGDVHYSCMRTRAHTGAALHPVGRLAQEPEPLEVRHDQFYFKTPAEMAADFADYPEAVARTLEIAERLHIELTLARSCCEVPGARGRDASLPWSSFARKACQNGTNR